MKPSNEQYLFTEKKRTIHPALLMCCFFLIGMLFYAWYNEIIILRIPSKSSVAAVKSGLTTRKKTKLYYYKDGAIKSEEKELLHATDNNLATIQTIVTAWLTFLDDEEHWPKRLSLQNVLLDLSGTNASLSFDQKPFSSEQSMQIKLHWVESLLKTVRDAGLPITSVRLFVHNKPLDDQHLDFSHPWPITGYTKS